MKSTLPLLDALDRRIVDLLTVDARVVSSIAAQLGVTEGTIRGRINRLRRAGDPAHGRHQRRLCRLAAGGIDRRSGAARELRAVARRSPPCPKSAAS
jgi:DNA-binding transcriptional regulator PaaX